jgi:hypothetical protein
MNIKRAGEYLNSAGARAVEVFTLPLLDPVANPAVAVPLLDLFTHGRIQYKYGPAALPAGVERATSSLRFTWEYQNPEYYTVDPDLIGGESVVVISGGPMNALPLSLQQQIAAFPVVKRFGVSSDPFRYKTIVQVYTRR